MEKLNLTAPINVLGYGTASYNLLIELTKLYDVALWPIGNIDYPVPEYQQKVIQQTLNNQATFDSHAPSLRIWHQFDMAQHIGRPKIGFPIFELNKFNDREKHHLKTLDSIFVCSKWAKEIIAREIGIEAHVVPLGVDREIFFDTPVSKNETYIFINVGKWEIRKGHDVLVTAFNNAFNSDDNVELWMMNHNPFLKPEQEKEWHDYYKKSKLGNKIRLLPRVQTQKDLSNLMRQAHCGVFPARAEGWNLEALEMLSCGRQVITTDFSAHTEFCTNENCKLIPITELEEAYDGIWFKGQGEWAKFGQTELDRLSYLMLESFKRGPEFNKAGVETGKIFSWENSAKAVKDGINETIN